MLGVTIMIEGQDGIGWDRRKRLGLAVEDLGHAGLYRSDHFTEPEGPPKEALELWSSLTWLAGNTERIEFGPLASPVSFRHPVITAWQASAVDSLVGGRLQLGLGAGWQEREHHAFGFDLLDTDSCFARFEEEVDRKLGVPREELSSAVIAGTADEFVERLGRLSEAGVQRVLLQWLETNDLDGLEAMAGSVLPQL